MTLILRHDDFYGRLQLREQVSGFTIAHRVAEGPPDAVATHTHVDAHFVLVTSGRYVSSAQGSSEERLPLIYNPPGTTHRDRFRDGVGSFFTVSFSGELLKDTTLGRPKPSACTLTDRRSRGLTSALLWTLAHGPECAGHLESLALDLVGGILEDGPRRPTNGRPLPWLDRVYEHLQDSSPRWLSVQELATDVGVHPVHLARAFRQRFRCTPGQMMQLRRLERAADRVLFSRLPLTEIVATCGFVDQSHMTTAFRHVYGMPPGRFRKSFVFTRRTFSGRGRIVG